MNLPFRIPSMKQVAIWLFLISAGAFVIGGMITFLDGGSYHPSTGATAIPVNISSENVSNGLITLEMDSGTVNILPGDDSGLITGAVLTSNAPHGPKKSMEIVHETAIVTFSQESSFMYDPFGEEDSWNLLLHPDIPVSLSIHTGAGNVSVDAGSIPLSSLDIETGAGDIQVNLTGWKARHLAVAVEQGLGSISILLPQNATIHADIENGLGSRVISGLEGADGHYVRNRSGPDNPVISLSVMQGVGDLLIQADPKVAS